MGCFTYINVNFINTNIAKITYPPKKTLTLFSLFFHNILAPFLSMNTKVKKQNKKRCSKVDIRQEKQTKLKYNYREFVILLQNIYWIIIPH